MEYEAAVSLQISGFDINLRFNIPVCQNPVSLECLAHHGILLPVARQAYLGGIFIGYPEQSRFQIKGISTALTRDDIAMFARLTGTELITIGEDTTEADLQKFFMK